MSNMNKLRDALTAGLASAGVDLGPLQKMFRGRHHKGKLLRRKAKIARKASTRRKGKLARAARKVNARA